MGKKPNLANNMLWNWAGIAVQMGAGFVLAPFLVHRLGDAGYGLWILMASLTSYLGLIELGMRSSVARHIAFARAKGDREGLTTILNTAQLIVGLAALVILLATAGILLVFSRVFQVPAEQAGSAQLAFFLAGAAVAVTIALGIFDAVLQAYERFDVANATFIFTTLLRLGLTYYFLTAGYGLIALATIGLATALVGPALNAVVVCRLDPAFHFAPWSLTRQAGRRLFGFGLWNSLDNVGSIIGSQGAPLIIGAQLTLELVTPYSIATRPVSYAAALFTAAAQVMTPIATTYHAWESHDQQQRLFLEGGKYSLALALFFLTLLVLLGGPFMALWIGPELASATPLLVILAVGEFFPMSQRITSSILMGMGRPRVLAVASVVENVAVISLALALAKPYGLLAVCAAVAVPAMFCRGLFQLVYASRALGLPLWRYVVEALLPALAVATPPALLLALLVRWRAPASWGALLVYAASAALVYLLVGFVRLGLRAEVIRRTVL
jgi:O-antigen/teichoic acid export membrane protein